MVGKKKTLAKITSGFTKIISELEALSDHNRLMADVKKADSATLLTEANDLTLEAEKAESFGNNLKKLLGSS